ncbi:MAG: ATP-dependent helicase [Planctomycetota bacterium]|jgi:DNA helicase-2/ATP-dependent DNA helicase PcrA
MDDRRQQFLFSNEPDPGSEPDAESDAEAAKCPPRNDDPKPAGLKKRKSRRRSGRAAGAGPEPETPGAAEASPASLEEILAGLTDAQRDAVEHVDGPMLVLAGAGSGKTRVITRRVARLIERGVPARSIMAITFTNKAAGEMKERVRSLVGDSRAWVSTFHAFCARLLREDIERLKGPGGVTAYRRDFVIYAEDDAQQTAADAMKEVRAPDDIRPAAARSTISRWKSSLVGPDEARAVAMKGRLKERVVADVYRVYERLLRERGALDFDDLLLKTLEVLRLDAEAREKWNRRYRHVQVDEYQDTNRIQYEIVRHLAGPERNVTVVGDPDQSIYSWRGAEPGNIGEFLRDFEGAKVVRLDTNFRSRQPVLDAASALIARNSGPRAGELKASRGGGELPRVLVNQDDISEAREVARRMSRRIADGRPPREIARTRSRAPSSRRCSSAASRTSSWAQCRSTSAAR